MILNADTIRQVWELIVPEAKEVATKYNLEYSISDYKLFIPVEHCISFFLSYKNAPTEEEVCDLIEDFAEFCFIEDRPPTEEYDRLVSELKNKCTTIIKLSSVFKIHLSQISENMFNSITSHPLTYENIFDVVIEHEDIFEDLYKLKLIFGVEDVILKNSTSPKK